MENTQHQSHIGAWTTPYTLFHFLSSFLFAFQCCHKRNLYIDINTFFTFNYKQILQMAIIYWKRNAIGKYFKQPYKHSKFWSVLWKLGVSPIPFDLSHNLQLKYQKGNIQNWKAPAIFPKWQSKHWFDLKVKNWKRHDCSWKQLKL